MSNLLRLLILRQLYAVPIRRQFWTVHRAHRPLVHRVLQCYHLVQRPWMDLTVPFLPRVLHRHCRCLQFRSPTSTSAKNGTSRKNSFTIKANFVPKEKVGNGNNCRRRIRGINILFRVFLGMYFLSNFRCEVSLLQENCRCDFVPEIIA